MTWLAGLFLLAHGLVHVGVWCTPFDPAKAPFDPRRSWLAARIGQERSSRGLAVVLAVAAAAAFLVAGTGVIIGAPWVQAVVITGATVTWLAAATPGPLMIMRTGSGPTILWAMPIRAAAKQGPSPP